MASSTWTGLGSFVNLDLTIGPLRLTDEPDPPEAAMNKQQGGLEAELSRISNENKRLSLTLEALHVDYITLSNKLSDAMTMYSPSRKRKCGVLETVSCSGTDEVGGGDDKRINCTTVLIEEPCNNRMEEDDKPKVSRIHVRTDPSDPTLVVRDGYQWRKYGQKVTRDNPSPRAYYKCSFAPSCPVKKKVQRDAEDTSIIVATYDGEHNHGSPTVHNSTSSPTNGSNSIPMVTLDLTRPSVHEDVSRACGEIESVPEFQHLLMEQIASTLGSDQNFRAALATAISGRIHLNPSVHD